MATIKIPRGSATLKTLYYFNDTTTDLFISDITKQWAIKDYPSIIDNNNQFYTISHLGRDTLRLNDNSMILY